MVDSYIDLNSFDAGAACYPQFIFEIPLKGDNGQQSVPVSGSELQPVRSAITDAGLAHLQDAYQGETISREDVFFYVYGLLHSSDYYSRYADSLRKVIPRIPRVRTSADFWAFVSAGRALGDLHLGFDRQQPWRGVRSALDQTDPMQTVDEKKTFYRVDKMRFGGKRPNLDRSRIVYNAKIIVEGIPAPAYDYVVNGKSAIEWVMERQAVTTDKDSGIVNDPNDYAIETMNDAAYPLKLLLSVITVSMRTMEIVNGLPALEIMEEVA